MIDARRKRGKACLVGRVQVSESREHLTTAGLAFPVKGMQQQAHPPTHSWADAEQGSTKYLCHNRFAQGLPMTNPWPMSRLCRLAAGIAQKTSFHRTIRAFRPCTSACWALEFLTCISPASSSSTVCCRTKHFVVRSLVQDITNKR